MTESTKQQLAVNKRLLEHQAKQPNASIAEIMEALKAIKEQEDTGVDNVTMMKDALGRDIYYMLLKKNLIKTFLLNIKKKVFELMSRVKIR